jgi:sodium-dependent phosphate cotransporter
MQIALCHLLFNLSGILLFYPLPFMRWPLTLCRILGRTTANYRWFAVFYLIFMFFLLPGFVLIISMAGPVCFLIVAVPLLVTLLLVVIVNVMQVKAARFLPSLLRTWDFLPLWLHSLDPIDAALWRVYESCCCCCAKYRHVATDDEEEVNDNGLSMVAVQ